MSGPNPSPIAQVPNVLTVLRLFAAAAFPFVPESWRVPLVVGAALSDWLDGFLARRYRLASPTGALLDGIADKAVTLSVLGTFTWIGLLTWWQLLLVLSRDFAVACMAAYVAWQREWPMFSKMVARWPGKATTFAVFGLMVVMLLRPEWTAWLLWPCCALSVIAAADYVTRFIPAHRAWRAGNPQADR